MFLSAINIAIIKYLCCSGSTATFWSSLTGGSLNIILIIFARQLEFSAGLYCSCFDSFQRNFFIFSLERHDNASILIMNPLQCLHGCIFKLFIFLIIYILHRNNTHTQLRIYLYIAFYRRPKLADNPAKFQLYRICIDGFAILKAAKIIVFCTLGHSNSYWLNILRKIPVTIVEYWTIATEN